MYAICMGACNIMLAETSNNEMILMPLPISSYYILTNA